MDPIFTRTSVRNYEAKAVESDKVEKLLRAAMAAPSAKNQQPWEFYVVREPKALRQLSVASPYAGPAAKAPLVIVICSDTRRVTMPECVELDLSAACENILLEAEVLGLGAVWLGIAPLEDRMAKVTAALELPDHLQPFAIVPVGYPVGKKEQRDRYDASRVHER